MIAPVGVSRSPGWGAQAEFGGSAPATRHSGRQPSAPSRVPAVPAFRIAAAASPVSGATEAIHSGSAPIGPIGSTSCAECTVGKALGNRSEVHAMSLHPKRNRVCHRTNPIGCMSDRAYGTIPALHIRRGNGQRLFWQPEISPLGRREHGRI